MVTYGPRTTGAEVVNQHKDIIRGKIIVITGASSGGLGAETAITLARGNPAQLVLLGRSIRKVQPVIDEIRNIDAQVSVHFVPVELDKISSVTAAAAKVNTLVSHIDILINNAGIMACPYSTAEIGVESQLAVNHIGHFVFTNDLLVKVKAAGEGARIVNLSSKGYKVGPFFFDDWNFSDGKKYNRWSAYGQSKTANILFTRYLAKALAQDGILAYAVHPGSITTTSLSDGLIPADFEDINEISLKNTGYGFEITDWKNIEEGIATTIVAAVDPQNAKHSGSYLSDCAIEELRDYASSEENARRLWKLSEEIVGRKYQL